MAVFSNRRHGDPEQNGLGLDEIFSADRPTESVLFDNRFDCWVVHGYHDVDRVLTEYKVFSSDEILYSAREVPYRDNPVLHSMSATDPPRHHELRRIVSQAFTPRTIDDLTDQISRIVHGLLDGVRKLEVVGDLATPLPIATISALLGMDPARRNDFVRWTEDITALFGPNFHQAVTELRAYLRDAVRQPSGVFAMLTASGLGEDDLLNFCALLLINGHETTKTLLVNTVLCLVRYPDTLAELRENPELVSAFSARSGRGEVAPHEFEELVQL